MAVRWIEAADLTRPNSRDADSAALAASWILYKLSGEKYPGTSTSTDWYCSDIESAQYSPFTSAFSHVNVYVVDDYTAKYLRLRSKPIQKVLSVDTGTERLDPSTYVVGNRSFIARTDGRSWDLGQGVT